MDHIEVKYRERGKSGRFYPQPPLPLVHLLFPNKWMFPMPVILSGILKQRQLSLMCALFGLRIMCTKGHEIKSWT